MYNIT